MLEDQSSLHAMRHDGRRLILHALRSGWTMLVVAPALGMSRSPGPVMTGRQALMNRPLARVRQANAQARDSRARNREVGHERGDPPMGAIGSEGASEGVGRH